MKRRQEFPNRFVEYAWGSGQYSERVRRYEKTNPGELVHVDAKRIAWIPEGGGWWTHGEIYTRLPNRSESHAAASSSKPPVDDHSRLAYVETLPDIKGESCADFWKRANAFFADHGITVQAVMTETGTDTGPASSPTL